MLTVCFPTFNRYDLVPQCIASANAGTIKPDKFLIIDNGGGLDLTGDNIEIYRPGYNTGVAGAWNWLIKNSSEDRIICNDDIQFLPDTIELVLDKLHKGVLFTWVCRPYGTLNGFSCYGIADALIERIGYFDENISPGYAYFEDNDYHKRMELAGIIEVDSEASAIHDTSSTLKALTPEQMNDHHRKFALAQSNYIAKWGGFPLQERFTVPYNREA